MSDFSLVDYRWGYEFELDSKMTLDTIGFMYNWHSIDYNLIVPGDNQDITQSDTLYSNMVSRFSPTVKDSSTLTIENGVIIDMYDSDLTVNAGSSILIGDSVIFNAKRGDCEITINGYVNNMRGVKFLADDSCTLTVTINNNNLDLELSDCDFENASSISMMAPGFSKSAATITNSSFSDPHPDENNLVSLYRFATYHITGDTFANWNSSYAEGQHSVAIEYSGTTGPTAMNNINENVFVSSENGYSNTNGILVYASIANIYNNNIQDQNVGVMLILEKFVCDSHMVYICIKRLLWQDKVYHLQNLMMSG